MSNIEVKSVYDLLYDKLNADFEAFCNRFIAKVKNGVFHEADCFDITIMSDICQFFCGGDAEYRITEDNAAKMLEVEDLLDKLVEQHKDYGMDYYEPVIIAVNNIVKEL